MLALSPSPTISAFRLLDRARTVAGTGYNRWLVPPAALAIHLSIGQAYAFSVFNLPLTRIIGVTDSAPEDWNTCAAFVDVDNDGLLDLFVCRYVRWSRDIEPTSTPRKR